MTAQKTVVKQAGGHGQVKRLPRQARAHATVERIIEEAGALLAEVGVAGLNTNLLAQRSDVTVPTVYRYFADKHAVLEELARRLVSAWGSWLDDDLLADSSLDAAVVWSGYVDAFVSGVAKAPAGLAVRAAIHSMPELRKLEDQDTRRMVDRLARSLRRRDPTLDAQRVRIVSETLLTTAIAVLDRAFTGAPRQRAARIRELKAIQIPYLESLLETGGQAGAVC